MRGFVALAGRAEAGHTATGNDQQVVDDLFESMFPQSVSKSFSVGNAAGWHAGRAAADLAVLDTHRAVASGGS